MSSRLVPCSGCDRHVRLSEAACPFCSSALPAEADLPPVVPAPSGRLGRAALFAFGAAAAGVVAVSGCGESSMPLYGAPPGDSSIAVDSTAPDGGGDAASDAASDAATDATADTGIGAMYGAPPADGG